MAESTSDSSISNQLILLIAGLVLGSLVGFLSEVAKEHYGDLKSRHVVRIKVLGDTDITCNPEWETAPAPIGRPTRCRQISYSLMREGNGSVSSLDVTLSLNTEPAAIVAVDTERKPEAFPTVVEITQSLSNERFNSRSFKISQFRSPQTLILTLSVGGSQAIPVRSGRVALTSSDEQLVVLEGSDYATFYFICFYISIFTAVILAVWVFLLYSRLRSYVSSAEIGIEG